jgi:dTDP-glucose 4,6-dehydratase
MTVLVTGAGGFIGSHLVEHLLSAGGKVRVLVKYNSRGSLGQLENLSRDALAQLEIEYGDITDAHLVRNLVKGCDIVFHLAALISIPYSYQTPDSYIKANLQGTLNVLQACLEAGVKRLIVTSTSEVYGTALYTPMDEAHPLQAQSPYAASKIAADKLTESFFCSYGLPVVTLRPFNTYGPRQSARAVIPAIMIQALSGAEEINLGNLSPKRDLTFVGDTARAFLSAAETPGIEGETIHFGQGKAISIADLARLCLEVLGSDARLVVDAERQRPAGSEVESLLCDPSKARRLINWQPQISLEEGLKRTAAYLRENASRYQAKYKWI